MALCIVTQAQCAWDDSGPTHQHVNFGNDNSFWMTGGASREERLTVLNENPADETKEIYVSWRGTYGIEASLPWVAALSSWGRLMVCMFQRAQRLNKATGPARACLVCPPSRDHAILIVLGHWFSARWNLSPSLIFWDIWQCLETYCYYNWGVALGI